MKRIYFIKSECNDNGWVTGFHYFEKKEDAITTMRNYVARFIRSERSNGKQVSFFKVWKDSVMDSLGEEPSQTITFKVKGNYITWNWEFRVWCAELHPEPLPKSKCFNF